MNEQAKQSSSARQDQKVQKKLWRFDPLDTWFFRESRPMDSAGGAELTSLFPPPARTIAGAVRSLVGEQLSLSWSPTNNRWHDDLLGRLRMIGPFPMCVDERIYPVPLMWLENLVTRKQTYLKPGAPVLCDLRDEAPVALPQMARPLPGAKPMDNAWVQRDAFQSLLSGTGTFSGLKKVVRCPDLITPESRLGIERNHETHAAVEHRLYQIRHIRPHETLSIGVEVAGAAEGEYPLATTVRLGAEGREAAVSVTAPLPGLQPPTVPDDHKEGEPYRILIVFLTHADFDGHWLPEKTLLPIQENGVGVWRGALGVKFNGRPDSVLLTVRSAVIGRPVREGGWQLGKGNQDDRPRPRAVRSLVPAGSCWFCETNDPDAVRKLNHAQIGKRRELGRGEIAAGYWCRGVTEQGERT